MYPPGVVLEPEERVELLTALRGVTTNPALQLGVFDKAGTLEVEKEADVVILDQDPRSFDASNLERLNVEQTWVGGSLVYDKSANTDPPCVTIVQIVKVEPMTGQRKANSVSEYQDTNFNCFDSVLKIHI